MKKLTGITAIMMALFVMAGVTPNTVQAQTSWVVNDGTADAAPCDGTPDFSTVQDAVDAAASGDTIMVCPGDYTELVTIATDDLSLTSVVPREATILAPGTITGADSIVHVDGATGVSIQDFTISGPGPVACHSINAGIFVGGGGQATISGNLVTDIRDAPLSGCQGGLGILVGRMSANEVGTATITNNDILNYQKGGIVVDNVGSDATISDNTTQGAGPIENIAQNGIQVSRGATAEVKRNKVIGNWYEGASWTSTGILLFETSDVMVQRNEVSDNQTGVAVQAWAWSLPAANDNRVIRNSVSGSAWGISVFAYEYAPYTSGDVTVDNNKVTNNVVIAPSSGAVTGIEVGSYEYVDAGFDPSADNNKVIHNDVDSDYPTDIDTSTGNTAIKVHANDVITP